MTRTVEEYVALLVPLLDAYTSGRHGDRKVRGELASLQTEMLRGGAEFFNKIMTAATLDLLRRGTGPMHVHVSPREGQEGER